MSPGHYPEAAICQLVLQGLATQSSGPCVIGRIHAAFSSILTCYSACLQCPKGQAGQGQREKKEDPHRETKKSKLWSLCHNVNWDKLMMHSQFLPGLPSQLTAWLLTLSAAGMQRYAAKINSSLPSLHNHFTCRWFHQESSSHDDYISKKYLLRESSYTNERSRYIPKLIVSPKIFQKVPLSG